MRNAHGVQSAHHARPGQPAPKPTGPARLSWRIMHSAWVVAPILPFSCLSATGFLYVGVRAKRPSWAIAGVIYSVIANVCFFFGSEAAADSVGQNVAYTIMFILWPISVVHAFIINASWLRWRAGHVPWYSQPQPVPYAGAPAPAATPLPPQLQDVVPPPQQFYGDPAPPRTAAPGYPPAAVSSPPAPASAYPPAAVSSPPAPASAYPLSPSAGSANLYPATPDLYPETSGPGSTAQSAGRTDVNTAGEEQLAALPGIGPERAARVVAARNARNGFSSLTEFAAAAGLAPHEFVAVRDRLSCDPPPPPPDSTEPPPFGRIVDV
ncbi:helix-hairpin-helix domain-containing protein [Actinoplanes sp. GCM10030250]|uniref:helix-hairpin-helix domain-containing protein n=1 Tax=Actinoplanes sp. GCM10030250 TaxID=3273376 RepID=UPI0036167C8D